MVRGIGPNEYYSFMGCPKNRTILLVDQDVRSAMAIADEVYVLDLGAVKTHGTKENFEGQLGDVVRNWLI